MTSMMQIYLCIFLGENRGLSSSFEMYLLTHETTPQTFGDKFFINYLGYLGAPYTEHYSPGDD